MRAIASGVPEVPCVSSVFQSVGSGGNDPRGPQGELVDACAASLMGCAVVRKVNAVWSDPISDMLTRIRNAVRVRRQYVEIPSSNLKAGIAKVLLEEGYIRGYDVIDDTRQGILRVELKYGPRGETVINRIDRVSRPGRRVYSKVADLPRVLDGLGTVIVSTSRGVHGDRVCREKRIGGELLCTVY